MVTKPLTTIKDSLQTDLNSILLTVEGKIDANMAQKIKNTAQKIKQAMDKLLEQDSKFNRDILVSAVDELLIISDSKELRTEEIKKILKFLESLKDFLEKGLKNLSEYNNILNEEQRKIKTRMEDIRETQRMRFGR